jgi:hypothetical protein
MLDHVRGTPEDTAGATVESIRLPAFQVPSLPLRLDPGDATTQIGFNLRGDTIHARWAVRSSNVQWARDSGLPRTLVGDLIWRTVSGISQLEVEARVSGPLAHPRLAVRSNLDQAIASRLRAVLGEEIAAAERRLRAQVDALVNAKVAPVRARVTELQTQVLDQVAQQRGRVDELQRSLEQRLRELVPVRLP